MLIIGLTGGIGSGKSTVTELFARHGVPIIDADVVGRSLVGPGSTLLSSLEQAFGSQVINSKGELDRPQLRDIVFNNAQMRAKLETIMHPAILHEMRRQASLQQFPYCIFSIPLLFETGQQHEVDRVVVVDSDQNIRIERVMDRDQLSRDQVLAIMNTQMDDEQRRALANDIITNTQDLKFLSLQVDSLHRRYMSMADQKDQQVSD